MHNPAVYLLGARFRMSPTLVPRLYSKTTHVDIHVKLIISLGKSVKVAGVSKQLDLMRNTDCRERSNLYYVIETGCIFNKSVKENY